MRGTSLFALAVIVMLAASQPAEAGGGHRHSHARFGIVIGAPLVFSPWWGPRYYYPSPPVVVRERVVVREPLVFYDEHGNPVPPDRPQPQAAVPPVASTPSWFFCPDSQAYYPYVQNCASPWQRVAPHPPPPN